MDELWQRIGEHKQRTLSYDRKTVALFKAQIRLGKYPEKCLDCYSLGINYCKWWEKKFTCEIFEIKAFEELVKGFE